MWFIKLSKTHQKVLYLLPAVVVLIITGWLMKPRSTHFHAGFQIYIDGKLQDYSASVHMAPEVCTLDEKDPVHLHNGVGDVVHLHRAGVTWKDLFTYLKLQLPENLPAEAYINGKVTSNLLSRQIKPNDSLILLIGNHQDVSVYLQQQVTLAHIQETTKAGESCGSVEKP